MNKTDEALKLLDALKVKYSDVIYDVSPHLAAKFEYGIAGIEQALAEPTVQEPVAWMQSDEVHISLWKDDYHNIPLFTTPPAAPVQEYVGVKLCWYESKEEKMCPKCGQVHAGAIFSKAKPAQPAVPLTDEQVDELWYKVKGEAEPFARAIEAAHSITEKGQP